MKVRYMIPRGWKRLRSNQSVKDGDRYAYLDRWVKRDGGILTPNAGQYSTPVIRKKA